MDLDHFNKLRLTHPSVLCHVCLYGDECNNNLSNRWQKRIPHFFHSSQKGLCYSSLTLASQCNIPLQTGWYGQLNIKAHYALILWRSWILFSDGLSFIPGTGNWGDKAALGIQLFIVCLHEWNIEYDYDTTALEFMSLAHRCTAPGFKGHFQTLWP